MPDVTVRRRYDAYHVELIVWLFPHDTGSASDALGELQRLHMEGAFRLLNAATLAKDSYGKVKVRNTADVEAAGGVLFGAGMGALIGLLGGPPGALVGAAAGTITGGLMASATVHRFPEQPIDDLSSALPENGSALVALAEHPWSELVVEALADRQARLVRGTVSVAWPFRTRWSRVWWRHRNQKRPANQYWTCTRLPVGAE